MSKNQNTQTRITTQGFMNFSWSQYLVLEADLMNVMRYITFEKSNMKTYSVEFIKQYQAICSEVDVQCKQYCSILEDGCKCEDMFDCASIILKHKPEIKNAVVTCKNLEFRPWEKWTTDVENPRDKESGLNKAPYWWTMYNKIKHSRLDKDKKGIFYYQKANLENVLNALSGLLVICLHCYKELSIIENDIVHVPMEKSKLLAYKDWESETHVLGDNVVITYE